MNKNIVRKWLSGFFVVPVVCFPCSGAFAQSRVGFSPAQVAKKTKLNLSEVAAKIDKFDPSKNCAYVDEVNREIEIFSNTPCAPEANGKVKGILTVNDFRNRVLVFAADTKAEQSELLASEFFAKALPRATKPGVLAVHLRQNWGKKRDVEIGEFTAAGSGSKVTTLCSGTYATACSLAVDEKGNLFLRMAPRSAEDLHSDYAVGK